MEADRLDQEGVAAAGAAVARLTEGEATDPLAETKN
jgi:hypothetical protein